MASTSGQRSSIASSASRALRHRNRRHAGKNDALVGKPERARGFAEALAPFGAARVEIGLAADEADAPPSALVEIARDRRARRLVGESDDVAERIGRQIPGFHDRRVGAPQQRARPLGMNAPGQDDRLRPALQERPDQRLLAA